MQFRGSCRVSSYWKTTICRLSVCVKPLGITICMFLRCVKLSKRAPTRRIVVVPMWLCCRFLRDSLRRSLNLHHRLLARPACGIHLSHLPNLRCCPSQCHFVSASQCVRPSSAFANTQAKCSHQLHSARSDAAPSALTLHLSPGAFGPTPTLLKGPQTRDVRKKNPGLHAGTDQEKHPRGHRQIGALPWHFGLWRRLLPGISCEISGALLKNKRKDS